MKASIKPVLLKHKKLKNGKYPVYLRVTVNRKIKYFGIGSDFCCHEKEWSKKEGQFKSGVKNYKEFNAHIDNEVQRSRTIALDLDAKGVDYTLEDFVLALTRKGKSILTLDYFDYVIKRMKENNRLGNADVYIDTKNALRKFLEEKKNIKNVDISLSSIDYKFLVEWEDFLRMTCADTTISLRLRTLRALFNKAINEEGFEHYPFKAYTLNHLNTKTIKRALKTPEMKEIFNFKADPKRRKYHSLNYFKFMYCCKGMNFKDLCLLKKEQIKSDSFEYIREKTGRRQFVTLFDVTKELLEEYKKLNPDSPYVFPILTPEHDTPLKIKTRIESGLKGLNNDLKAIAAEISLDKNVTSYVARHTFATVLRRNGETVDIIQEEMGHADTRTTLIYLEELDDGTIKTSAEKAIRAIL